MSDAKSKPRDQSAPPDAAPAAASEPDRGAEPTQSLVDQLVAGFTEQLHRALEVELPAESSALAYVDHYLSLLREEEREPIISLVAAGAGAWFGELIRREIGGQWIGDGSNPRRLRLLLEPQFVHFSPVDMAYEAIFVGSPDPGDPRLPEGAALDGAYHLRKRPAPSEDEDEDKAEELDEEPQSDHEWVADRLAEVPPVPEDQFYSLTGRFETLQLILELLASRDLARGRKPTLHHLNDYIAGLS